MMKRSTAIQRISYWHELNPAIAELLELNKTYSCLLDQAKRHEDDEADYDRKKDRLANYSNQLTPSLQKEFEALEFERLRIHKNATTAKDKIQALVTKVYGMFPELLDEYRGGELSDEKFKDFLLSYKKVIESSNNLSCFKKTNHFQEITEAIRQHYPEINKN